MCRPPRIPGNGGAPSPRHVPSSRPSTASLGNGGARRPANTPPFIPDLEVLARIGKGAYGEVWLARSLTGAFRAVKIVWREDFEDERSFVREFEGILNYEPVARNNPGLVHILHVGRGAEPSPFYYYVMELADDARTGIHIAPSDYVPRTLRSDKQLYGNRPLPLDYTLEVGSQLARALQYLHSEGLTHRDVKPANIVFVNGRPKLADIGLVAHADQHSFVGTEGFIPPEGPGSPRADTYALAKVLYEIATGNDRLDFPELPGEKPEGASKKKWLALNDIICEAAEPRLEKCTIATAEELADRIDELRVYKPRRKTAPHRAGSRFPWKTVSFSLALGLALAWGIVHWNDLEASLGPRLCAAWAGLTGESAPPEREADRPGGDKPLPEESAGLLYITSVPAGASIYTSGGKYVDETPYGPIAHEAETHVSFVLRREGFADKLVEGIIPKSSLLALGGDLKPYHPPTLREEWKDALGNVYLPGEKVHTAASPVSAENYRTFLESLAHPAPFPHQEAAAKEKGAPKLVLTSPEGIGAYILWLTRQCIMDGLLGRDHTLNAEEEEGLASADGRLKGYRLTATPVRKTPITILTNPAGAAVWLNGLSLGVTPMQNVSVPLAPYYLELKMPGYTTVRHSGLNPKGLFLSLNLEPNNSVVFGQDWINSLGMRFVSMGPHILAGATEVRVADYAAFSAAEGREAPPPPPFEQNGHHPVVNLTRGEAEAFAAWLTKTEREKGLIEPTDAYRLPSDAEWSALAGLSPESGGSPYARQANAQMGGSAYNFLWGTRWPPSRRSGNFADLSALPGLAASRIIPNYDDGHPFTAPVGAYTPNGRGVFDLSGNVQEWVSDDYGGPRNFRFRSYGVVRGGSFQSFRPSQLVPTHRVPLPADTRSETVGFRLLLERRHAARL